MKAYADSWGKARVKDPAEALFALRRSCGHFRGFERTSEKFFYEHKSSELISMNRSDDFMLYSI
ncbi:hypothetical protein [Halobacillus sp. B23F22_1]|uniref:hypothetical protein n=1 Tax=Halobacillus sp. B23F22_1 TaxID=3459514 RepID=UPI00373FC232